MSEINKIEEELDKLGWSYGINDQSLENGIIDKERYQI